MSANDDFDIPLDRYLFDLKITEIFKTLFPTIPYKLTQREKTPPPGFQRLMELYV